MRAAVAFAAVAVVALLCGAEWSKPGDKWEVDLRFQGDTTCSGVIVGPNHIATASHCESFGGALTAINGQPVVVKDVKHTGSDQIVIEVDKAFANHARWSATLPKQGDRIYFWGTPERIGKLYREGYVAGVIHDMIIIDAEIGHGDSGAGVYDSRGRVIGTLSQFLPTDLDHLTHTRFGVVAPYVGESYAGGQR